MSQFVLLIPLVPLLIGSICDLRTREIPDWIPVGLTLTAIAAAAFGWAGIQWWMVLSGSLLGLLIGYGLFRFAKLGGGDAKLIIGIGAMLGPVGLLIALFWTALAGGVLALIAMCRGQRDYAYGPAIAVGYAAYLIYPAGIPTAVCRMLMENY